MSKKRRSPRRHTVRPKNRRYNVLSYKRGQDSQIIKDHLEQGELTKHGYDVDHIAGIRRRALAKSIKEDGALTVWRRLHLQAIYRKNAPAKSREGRIRTTFRRDRDWVKRNYMQ